MQKEYYVAKRVKVGVKKLTKKSVTLRVYWDDIAWKEFTLIKDDFLNIDPTLHHNYIIE